VVYVKKLKHPRPPKGKLELFVPLPLRQAIMAMAYHAGMKGNRTRMAIKLLSQGVESYIAGLKPSQKRDFDEILENVKLSDSLLTESSIKR
jgi:hypothetical protein